MFFVLGEHSWVGPLMRGPPVCHFANTPAPPCTVRACPIGPQRSLSKIKSLFIPKHTAETFPKDCNANSVDTKLIENRAHVEKRGHRCAAHCF